MYETWEQLKADCMGCRKCDLCETRTNLVFGVGNENAEVLFVGDDWYGTEKWKKYEREFAEYGIRIIYFPYTKGISSTKITEALNSVRRDDLSDLK